MDEQGFLTVGQLAKRVGTTVRTIQYYDQQGLLSPSAKGPGNQRLYSPSDVEELYRILTLKYLGLSLADIRDRKDEVRDAVAFRRLLAQAMEEVEVAFQDLVKRLLVLHALFSESGRRRDVSWEAFARTIEGDDAGELFWDGAEPAGDEGPDAGTGGDAGAGAGGGTGTGSRAGAEGDAGAGDGASAEDGAGDGDGTRTGGGTGDGDGAGAGGGDVA